MTMRDSELVALIDREARQAIGVEDAFANDRMRAMEFYRGEAKGELSPPSVPGRSRVVSKDLMDTVEWAMPGLMDALCGEDIVCFEPDNEQDEQGAEDASRYVSHLFFERSDGFTVLYEAIKSCLIARMGVVKVYCDKSSELREEKYRGLSQVDLDALKSDPDVEIVETTEVQAFDEGGQPVLPGYEAMDVPPEMAVAFDVTCRRKEETEKYVCEGVPPEEIRISKECRQLEKARFIAHEVERTRSDLVSLGWPKKIVDRLPAGGSSEGDAEKESRRSYDYTVDDEDVPDPSQETILVTEAYVRCDFDQDGHAEYRRVVKSHDYVHENEVTDDHPFALFSPILMPYKVIGLSFYDLVEDLQRIKTALTRQVLDNVYLSNNPRTEVVEGRVNLDDLLTPRPGGFVRVKEIGSTREIATPFVAGAGMQLIEHFDQLQDTRTGVTETNAALNAESLGKGSIGSEGVQSMMQAGAQRQKLIARVLAETGLKRIYLLLLKLVTQYQDRAEQVKINGRWMAADPREWRNQYRVSVRVGLGTADRAEEMANLQMLAAAQREAFQLGLATPENVHYLLTRIVKAMRYRDPGMFFAEPQPPDPNNPPEVPEAVQLEQMKQQGAQQLEGMRQQGQAQIEQLKAHVGAESERMKQEAQQAQAQAELSLQAERDRMKIQSEMELERYKAEMAMQVELEKARIAQQTELEKAAIAHQQHLDKVAAQQETDFARMNANQGADSE